MPGSDRPSIHDVARKAGVSAATVSKFLHGNRSIKPANVARIQDAIDALGYRLDPLAADLRRSKRKIIGLVVPELENEFFGRWASHLELLAEEQGYSLSITSSHGSETREAAQVARLHDWRIAGLILAPVRSERGSGAQEMKRHGLTGVLVDRVLSDPEFDTVAVDNAGASAGVCRHLAEYGHEHVLIVGPDNISKNARARISGFVEEAKRVAPNMRTDILETGDDLTDIGQSIAEALDVDPPTAVYSVFQRGTLAALTEFRRRGLRCPEDVSLVGFDDAEWMQATFPAISAVVQPVETLAKRTFERLMSRIDGLKGAPVAHLEPCSFAMRESVASPRPGTAIEGVENASPSGPRRSG